MFVRGKIRSQMMYLKSAFTNSKPIIYRFPSPYVSWNKFQVRITRGSYASERKKTLRVRLWC
jgi:hypothetical protein